MSKAGGKCPIIVTVLPQLYINSPVLFHNLFLRDLHISFSQDITPVHCIDYIMLIGLIEQEALAALGLMVINLYVKGWEINLPKIWGLLPQ